MVVRVGEEEGEVIEGVKLVEEKGEWKVWEEWGWRVVSKVGGEEVGEVMWLGGE